MIDLGNPSYAHEFSLTLRGFGKTEITNHARLDIIYMLCGSAGIKTAYRACKLDATHYCVLNVMELRHITWSENAQALQFSISSNLLMNPLRRVDFCSSDPTVSPEDDRRFRALIARAFQLYYRDAENNRFGIYSCLYAIVDLLYRGYSVPEQIVTVGQEKVRLLEQMLCYIQENSSQNLQLGDLAKRFYLSSGHVSRMFQQNLHTTFTNYLREVRLNKAYDLLMNTQQSVTDIAVNCGFGSTNRFIDVFSKKFGETPGKFRRHDRKEDVLPQLREQTQLFDDLLKYAQEPNRPKTAARPIERSVVHIPEPRNGRRYDPGFFRLINVGWAKELLYDAVRLQLKEAQRQIHFEFVRFHGLFDEDMMVYQEDASGAPLYNFTYVDMVYDYILSIGLKPHVEFGYFPRALAEDLRVDLNHHSYIYGMPNSMEKWCALVRETVRHWTQRYGPAAVRQWRFCTGEGHNLYYRRMSPEDFLELYRETRRAVLDVDPLLQFGFSNLDLGMLHLEDQPGLDLFLRYMTEYGCLPEFYSFQCFHNDYSSDYKSTLRAIAGHGTEPAPLSDDENYLSHNLRAVLSEIQKYDARGRPVLLDTWNATIWQRDLRGDTCFKSAFLFKNMLENADDVSAFGYWNLSDLFEEVHASSRLFHGGYGLMTYNGIPKAGFNAFSLLRQLGSRFVGRGDGWFVTCEDDGRVQVALYNYCHYDTLGRQHLFVEGNERNPYEMFKKSLIRQFDLKLDLPDGDYCVEKWEIARRGNSGSAYDLWVNMGAPDLVTPEQVEYLKSRSVPRYTIRKVAAREGLNLSEALNPHDVCVIEIRPLYGR